MFWRAAWRHYASGLLHQLLEICNIDYRVLHSPNASLYLDCMQTQANWRGCDRNMALGGDLVDWFPSHICAQNPDQAKFVRSYFTLRQLHTRLHAQRFLTRFDTNQKLKKKKKIEDRGKSLPAMWSATLAVPWGTAHHWPDMSRWDVYFRMWWNQPFHLGQVQQRNRMLYHKLGVGWWVQNGMIVRSHDPILHTTYTLGGGGGDWCPTACLNLSLGCSAVHIASFPTDLAFGLRADRHLAPHLQGCRLRRLQQEEAVVSQARAGERERVFPGGASFEKQGEIRPGNPTLSLSLSPSLSLSFSSLSFSSLLSLSLSLSLLSLSLSLSLYLVISPHPLSIYLSLSLWYLCWFCRFVPILRFNMKKKKKPYERLGCFF